MLPSRSNVMAFVKARHAMAGSLLSLTIKTAGALLMMLIFVVTARTVSQADFGRLAVAFNALTLLSVWSMLGQDTLFARSWGEYRGRHDDLAHGVYWFGWRVLSIGAGLACVTVIGIATIGPWRFSTFEIGCGCLFLVAQSVLQYSSNTCRHIVNFVISELNREVLWRVLLLATVLLAWRSGLAPPYFFLAASAGMVLATAIETVAVARTLPSSVRTAPPRMPVAEWLRRSRSLAASAIIESSTQLAEVMLLGVLVSPSAAAAYFAAARIANIFAMLTIGLHTYTVSYAANLYFSGQLDRLQAIMRSVMVVALGLTTPIAILILCAGSPILGLFGPDYAHETGTLLLLAGTSYVGTLSGPAGGLLQITGHEKLYSRVIFCALVVRVGLLLWLAPRYGAFGAALAWATVNGPLAIGLSAASRPLCGIDPSVLAIVARRRLPAETVLADPR